MRISRMLLVAVATLTLACESPTSPASQLLSVSSDGTVLRLENPNAWPVYYMATDPNVLMVAGTFADFALCTDPASSCPRVAPFGTVRLPYAEIVGYHSGQTVARVTQWRLQRQNSGEYNVTDVHSLDVPLR